MKKFKIITIIIFILLFCILIGLHAFLIYKLLPIINNIQKLTDNFNDDYEILYNRIQNILNETEFVIKTTNKSLINLNNTISNLNKTINSLEENLKIDL
jgi:predicted PurR-regulated permease PerM